LIEILLQGGFIMAFKIGDVVSLKSNSAPKMTVAKVDSSGLITCQWFIDSNLKEASFREEMLKLYEAPAFGASNRGRPNYS
jgi:uncharacterized protein YodC (DUF2158 family)